MHSKSIILLAGEASGDYHAAALVKDIRNLRPDIRVMGIGGDKLQAAGMELMFHYRDINTIGLSEGLGKVKNIIAAYKSIKAELQSGRHDLFIPVDFPDVNLRLCKFARKAGVPVCYYISPQVWAWRKGRIKKIASRVDKMMTIFPFEAEMYRDAGIDAVFVGHTMVRDLAPEQSPAALRKILGIPPNAYAIALVPGSRPAEITRILPVMSGAAEIFFKRNGLSTFILPLAGEHLRPLVSSIAGKFDIPLTITNLEASKVMAACNCGLVTSGTATLQAALAGMPHAVVYKLDAITWFLAMKVIKPLLMDKDLHIAMANVLAINAEKKGTGPINFMPDAGCNIPCQECGRPLFVPEVLQEEATPENLAGWLIRFDEDRNLSEVFKKGFDWIRTELADPPGSNKAADAALQLLKQ